MWGAQAFVLRLVLLCLSSCGVPSSPADHYSGTIQPQAQKTHLINALLPFCTHILQLCLGPLGSGAQSRVFPSLSPAPTPDPHLRTVEDTAGHGANGARAASQATEQRDRVDTVPRTLAGTLRKDRPRDPELSPCPRAPAAYPSSLCSHLSSCHPHLVPPPHFYPLT